MKALKNSPRLIDELFQQLRRRHFHGLANLNEFGHIEPTFSTLIFRNKRLWLTQTLRQLDLRQPDLVPCFAHQGKKLAVQR